MKVPQPMGGCVVGWVDVWVSGWGQVKSLIINKSWLNLDNSFFILFEDLIFMETPPAMGGCVGGWMDGYVDV